MKTTDQKVAPSRFFIGLAVMLLTASVGFTFTAYGLRLFFPYFLVVLGVATCLTVFLALPIALAQVKFKQTGFLTTVISIAAATLIVFLIWNYIALAGATTIKLGGKLLVEQGILTKDGLIAIARDSAVTAIIAAVAAACFWAIAFWRRH